MPKAHRRTNTIAVGNFVEQLQIREANKVTILNDELEKQSKELEETQHEVHMAAEIGQRLLQKTQEMDIEIETTRNELLSKSATAEEEIHNLQCKNNLLIQSSSDLRAKYALVCEENDVLATELTRSSKLIKDLKAELHNANGEVMSLKKEVADLSTKIDDQYFKLTGSKSVQNTSNIILIKKLELQIQQKEEDNFSLRDSLDDIRFKYIDIQTQLKKSHKENLRIKKELDKNIKEQRQLPTDKETLTIESLVNQNTMLIHENISLNKEIGVFHQSNGSFMKSFPADDNDTTTTSNHESLAETQDKKISTSECKFCNKLANKNVDKFDEAVQLLNQILPHSLMSMICFGVGSVLTGSIVLLKMVKKNP